MDKNEILRAAQSGKNAQDILKSLGADDRAAVEKLLSDKQATERLLSSPEAQALYKALFGGKKNG